MKYNIFSYLLTTALDQVLDISGGFVYIKDATDTLVNVDVQIDSRSNDKINLKKSYGVVGKFNKLYISALAQAGKTVQIFVSDSYESLRLFEQAATPDIGTLGTITNPVKIEPARVVTNNAVIAVGTSQTSIADLALTRKFLHIKSCITNTGIISIGITGITLGNGMVLFPGEYIKYESSAAFFAIAEIANSKIYISEERES